MPSDPYVSPTSWLSDGRPVTIETEWDGQEAQAQLQARHDAAARRSHSPRTPTEP